MGYAWMILILPTPRTLSPTWPRHLTIQVTQQPTPIQIRATTGRNRKVTGLVGQKCEPWICQLLVQGYMEISASSCYQLCNSESIVHPWCSQINLYPSIHLYVVAVMLYSESPESCAIIGMLAQYVTLWGSVAEQNRRWRPSSIPEPFCLQGLL